MTRALITGISGFVGYHLRKLLIEEGWQVWGFDIRSSGENVFVGDITDSNQIVQAIATSNPDVVFHLAGIIKSKDNQMYFKSNLFGTMNLLDAIMKVNIRPKVVLASTSAVYGFTERTITERSKLRPVTMYALSKIAQEMALFRYYYAFGLPVIITRMFNLLGPGQSPDLACSSFARQIALAELNDQTEILTGNLTARRDFVDVRDAVYALATLAEQGGSGEVYNICTARAVAIQECLSEMMSMAVKQLSVRVDARLVQKNDVPVQVGSYKKLNQATGWSPKIPLRQSLAELLDDWRIKFTGSV